MIRLGYQLVKMCNSRSLTDYRRKKLRKLKIGDFLLFHCFLLFKLFTLVNSEILLCFCSNLVSMCSYVIFTDWKRKKSEKVKIGDFSIVLHFLPIVLIVLLIKTGNDVRFVSNLDCMHLLTSLID